MDPPVHSVPSIQDSTVLGIQGRGGPKPGQGAPPVARGVQLARPWPREPHLVLPPVEALLVEENEGDVARRRSRPGKQAYAPVPGPVLDALERPGQPQGQRDGGRREPDEEPQQNAPSSARVVGIPAVRVGHGQIFPSAAWYDLLRTGTLLGLMRNPDRFRMEVAALPRRSWVVVDEVQSGFCRTTTYCSSLVKMSAASDILVSDVAAALVVVLVVSVMLQMVVPLAICTFKNRPLASTT